MAGASPDVHDRLRRGGATRVGSRPPADALRSAPLIRPLRYMLLWNKQLRRWIYPFDLLGCLAYRLYLEAGNAVLRP